MLNKRNILFFLLALLIILQAVMSMREGRGNTKTETAKALCTTADATNAHIAELIGSDSNGGRS